MPVEDNSFTLEETPQPLKLEGPTLRIKGADGRVVLAASTNGGSRQHRDEIEALVDKALAALNAGGKKGKA